MISPSSHEIPQVKILDYVTIQKQGPYLQQLHTKLSLIMYIGALRLTGENDGCSHMMFVCVHGA